MTFTDYYQSSGPHFSDRRTLNPQVGYKCIKKKKKKKIILRHQLKIASHLLFSSPALPANQPLNDYSFLYSLENIKGPGHVLLLGAGTLIPGLGIGSVLAE